MLSQKTTAENRASHTTTQQNQTVTTATANCEAVLSGNM
jgi:hypothetical protein